MARTRVDKRCAAMNSIGLWLANGLDRREFRVVSVCDDGMDIIRADNGKQVMMLAVLQNSPADPALLVYIWRRGRGYKNEDATFDLADARSLARFQQHLADRGVRTYSYYDDQEEEDYTGATGPDEVSGEDQAGPDEDGR